MKSSNAAGAIDTWDIAVRLRSVLGRLFRLFRDKAGIAQRPLSHTFVLTRLERDGPSTVTELARWEGLRPQSMSVIVGELEAAGLVCRTANLTDGRRATLSITDAGKDAVRVSREELQGWLVFAVEKKLTPAEREHLAVAIELFERLI